MSGFEVGDCVYIGKSSGIVVEVLTGNKVIVYDTNEEYEKKVWRSKLTLITDIEEISNILSIYDKHQQKQKSKRKKKPKPTAPKKQAIPKARVRVPVPTELFDDKLKDELSKIAMNQLNFFRSINQWYTELLINDQYDDKEGNSKQFWENVIIDYENYMTNLSQNINSTPPISLEMELIWRVHLLSPQIYVKDCVRQFGRIINHNCDDPKTNYIRHNSNNFRNEVLKNPNPGNTGFIGPDLIMTDALKRQCKFIRKIIKVNLFDPINKNKIGDSVERYEKFLKAMWAENKPQGLIMVPTLDIDLIWHSHQLNLGLCIIIYILNTKKRGQYFGQLCTMKKVLIYN